MSVGSKRKILEIIATDDTFVEQNLRGERVWVGKCFYCGTRLVIGLDGALLSDCSVEHILSRNHGGTDDLENLALACTPCNVEKGRRHDARRRADPEVVRALLEKRRGRWRGEG